MVDKSTKYFTYKTKKFFKFFHGSFIKKIYHRIKQIKQIVLQLITLNKCRKRQQMKRISSKRGQKFV